MWSHLYTQPFFMYCSCGLLGLKSQLNMASPLRRLPVVLLALRYLACTIFLLSLCREAAALTLKRRLVLDVVEARSFPLEPVWPSLWREAVVVLSSLQRNSRPTAAGVRQSAVAFAPLQGAQLHASASDPRPLPPPAGASG